MAANRTVKVHSYKPSPNVAKSEIAGKFGGVSVEYIEGFEMGKTNKTEEFLNLNPNGQVPTMITDDGPLFESNAMAYYVARIGSDAAGLLGDTPYKQALVDQWTNWSRSRVEGTYALFAFTLGWGKYDQTKFDETMKKITDALAVLERHFNKSGTPFLLGDRITLADIIVVCPLIAPLRVSITEEVLTAYPKTRAFLGKFLSDPHVVSVTGEIHIAKTFTAPTQ